MEKLKHREETYYLDNITIVSREIVFIVIVRRYHVVSNKSERKYSPKTLASILCSVRIYAKSCKSPGRMSYFLKCTRLKFWS